MRVPPGYRVNPAYAPHSACPACGSMLRRLARPFTVVLRSPAAPDDERIVKIVGDGFKGEERTAGWRHTATLRCPRCKHIWSPAQAVRRDFRAPELPADFFVPEGAADGAGFFSGLAESLKRGDAGRVGRAAAEPRQALIWDEWRDGGDG